MALPGGHDFQACRNPLSTQALAAEVHWITVPVCYSVLRVSDRMRERARAAEPFGEEEHSLDRRPLRRLLDPAVRVEEARFEVEDQLPDTTEAEVAWLDDPRVDGTDRHLHHPFTSDAGDGCAINRAVVYFDK